MVIKNKKNIGIYESAISAINKTQKTEQLGTFIVQFCNRDELDVQII